MTLHVVAETPTFIRQAAALWTDAEKKEVIDFLAAYPTAGSLIPGGSGIRKVRVPISGRGKRGGARVVYFYADQSIPLYLLAAYAKNQASDLSPEARKQIARLTTEIKRSARRLP